MEEILTAISIICLVLGSLSGLAAGIIMITDSGGNKEITITIFKTLTITLFIFSFIFISLRDKTKDPKALDVYRGKTELVITSKTRGNIVIEKDSTVIWK